MHGIDQVTVSKKWENIFWGKSNSFFRVFLPISCQWPKKKLVLLEIPYRVNYPKYCTFLQDFCPLCSGLGPPDASIFGSVHLWELLLASTYN